MSPKRAFSLWARFLTPMGVRNDTSPMGFGMTQNVIPRQSRGIFVGGTFAEGIRSDLSRCGVAAGFSLRFVSLSRYWEK